MGEKHPAKRPELGDDALMLDRRALPSPLPPSAARIPKVLLVDDDATTRRLLQATLGRSGFEVLMAASGEEALKMIAEVEPDLLVLDFEMPDLTGAEVCHRLRADDRAAFRELPVIMLTAHSGEAEEIDCLHAGASDFVTKPVSRAVLEARIHTQLRLRALSREMRRHNEELGRWRVAQEADLAAARATQQALIPTAPPALAGWSVQTVYRPLIQVGGDVFGWRALGHGRKLFWLADATGHGAAAALFTALAAVLFSQASDAEAEPSAILRGVNREFCRLFGGRSFMSACCAVINSRGTLRFASAGHPPLMVRRASGAIESFGPHGMLLGINADLALDQSRTALASGDSALLFTDGLFALSGDDGERFTLDAVRLALAAVAPGEKFFDRFLANIASHSNGEPSDDDVAGIVLAKV